MFTGLIEEKGRITRIEQSGDGAKYTIFGPKVTEDITHGDSISVNGVCLTAIEITEDSFTADVMKQTIDMSSIASLTEGSEVNLERAAQVGSRLGGHIVQGHVDGSSTVLQVRPGDEWSVLRFTLSDDLAPLVVDKGSICVDGVSLTVSDLGEDENGHWFEVSLIPETLTSTTLGALKTGDIVNIETDIVARHVQRLYQFDRK